VDGPKVAETIRGLTHQGAQGEIRFDAKGDVLNSPYIVWTVKNGVFEQHWTPGAS
jgi:ABC-type branched-subunit amino acid transport system substrate-binding protein